MPRCRGTTQAGSRCRRAAPEGSDYCSQHEDQAPEDRGAGSADDPFGDGLKIALGVLLVGAILYLGFPRRF